MELLSEIGRVLLGLWWVWLTFIAGWVFISIWIAWRQLVFKSLITWSLLEIKLPREAKKSAKAMEHILMNIWALRNTPGNMKEWYWDGETTLWFSFEIVSFGGDIHFYVRTPARYTNIIKANFYGQYPECEVQEVEDYIDRFPDTVPGLYENGYDIFGFEMFLKKNNAYPIRTYEYFESDEETQNLDPIAPILETLAKLDNDEIMMMQIIARPAADPLALVKLANKEVEVLKEKFGKRSEKMQQLAADDLLGGLTSRTPGETDIFKFVEGKASKNAFDVVVRSLYLAPKAIFLVMHPYRSIRSSYQQFALPTCNFFDVNYRSWTRAWLWDPPYIFPKRVNAGRKARMWDLYRRRALPADTFTGKAAQFHVFTSTFTQKASLLNTEELATLWHLPTEAVLTQPILERIESKKMGPPPGLPIFREGTQEPPGIMR